ncbi:hypothetical protein [Nocardioides koreensis]|uniref:hypothetical protein n=1 Tax=Nocardioides koreensis TaxID=433651 RepID=UPI0031DC95AB
MTTVWAGLGDAGEPLQGPDQVDPLGVGQLLAVALERGDPALDGLGRGQRRGPAAHPVPPALDHVPDPRTDHRHWDSHQVSLPRPGDHRDDAEIW